MNSSGRRNLVSSSRFVSLLTRFLNVLLRLAFSPLCNRFHIIFLFLCNQQDAMDMVDGQQLLLPCRQELRHFHNILYLTTVHIMFRQLCDIIDTKARC